MPAPVLKALALVFGKPSGRWPIALAVSIAVALPLLFMTAVVAVIGGQRETVVQACGPALGTTGSGVGAGGSLPAGLTRGARARFYEPLRMQPGRWYRTGATRFNAPGDATAYGSIPDPGQHYLPDHPDTFAELALASTNPANYRDFRFEDADALGRLPYMTAVRVERGGRSVVVYKRDVGYGQGTDTTASGERYRIDVWGPSADAIAVSKDEVRIALAAPNGAAQTLGDTPDAALEQPDQAGGQPLHAGPPDRHGGLGFTPAPGSDFTSGEEPEIARRADALGRALHLRLIGVSGRRTSEHNRAVGGAPGSAHLTGRAADIDGLQTVPVATLHRYGLDRPVAHYVDSSGRAHDERNHVALLPGTLPPAVDDAAVLAECSAAIDIAGPSSRPLPLTPGERARLLPNELAAAPQDAPVEVKRIIAAGNEIVGKPYLLGGGHGVPLSQIADTYDCSSAVAHLLYGARLVDVSYTPASGDLDDFGEAGYGRWVSLLSNDDHAYLYVAGLRFDTHNIAAGERGNPGIGWHTGHRDDIGFTARHPKGL